MGRVIRDETRLMIGDTDAAEMLVCGDCGRVRGRCHCSMSGSRVVTLDQRCKCHRGDEPTWPRFDYNTAVELCWCCAAEAVGSGSRWSVFLCPECKQRAIRTALPDGGMVVPIGRHSLMNRVHLAVDDVWSAPSVVPEFAERLIQLGGRITVLWERGGKQALANLAAIGAGDRANVPLIEYLDAVAGLPVDKEAAFREACLELGVDPTAT